MRSRKYVSVSADYLTTNLAYSALLSVLPLIITQQIGSASIISGIMLGVLSAAARGSTLFLGRVIERVSTFYLMQCGLGMTVLGLLVFSWMVEALPIASVVGLILLGVGVSVVNFTLRGHIIATTADAKEQTSFFSLVSLCASGGAAIGPIVASFMQKEFGLLPFVLLLTGIYVVAFLCTGVFFDRRVYIRTAEEASEKSRSSVLVTLRGLLSSRTTMPVVVIVVIGSVMNGQLFSGMAFEFQEFSSSLLPAGVFFTVDAVAVICLQLPVNMLILRIMSSGKTSSYCMGVSLAWYSTAFLLFAAGTLSHTVGIICAALILFSAGECMYAPLTNVAMVESGESMPLVDVLNCRLLLTAVGESLGSFCGGFLVPLFIAQFHTAAPYWAALALIAACTLGSLLYPTSSSRRYNLR
ncbi:MFS transporter [Alloscardovia macacae]|nr:MFS transporter [Alloscardovia macacae]